MGGQHLTANKVICDIHKILGGGLCFYIKESIDYTVCSDGLNDENFELMTIIIKRNFQKDIMVVHII